jgi:hypothetical protein
MKTRVFKLQIECGNAAFDGDPSSEIARILHRAAERLEAGEIDSLQYLFDYNGNRCGTAELKTVRTRA